MYCDTTEERISIHLRSCMKTQNAITKTKRLIQSFQNSKSLHIAVFHKKKKCSIQILVKQHVFKGHGIIVLQ